MSHIETIVTVKDDEKTKESAKADRKRKVSSVEASQILESAFEEKKKSRGGETQTKQNTRGES